MNEQQKETLLFTFDTFNEIYGRTYIQKMFFVFKEQLEIKFFNYFNYKFGPFSQELNQAVSELADSGYVQERRIGDYYMYSITEKGKRAAKKQTNLSYIQKNKIRQFCSYAKERRWKSGDLLGYVYRKYPESTTKSILKNKDA